MSYEELQTTYQYLRSMRRLMKRSPIWWPSTETKLEYVFSKQGFASTMHIDELIKELTEKRVGPEETYDAKKTRMQIPESYKDLEEEEIKAIEYMKNGSRLRRARNWQWRLKEEINEAVKNKWFPLFGTYTVDPKRLPEGCLTRDDLWKNTPAWDRFIKKFKTAIAEECGYGRKPAKWPPGHTFFKYLAVIEHGKSGEHPHVHVVWLCKRIPRSWKNDPNRNSSVRTETDIPAASALWEHGVQRCTMGLFIVDSWFAKNWLVPIGLTDGKPRKISDANSVAGYISKYITKGETKKWHHRVKATRNLGMNQLKEELKGVQLRLLFTMSTRPSDYTTSMMIQEATEIPMGLLREKSKTELMRRLHSLKTQRAEEFLRKEWTKKPPAFYMNMMLAAQAGVKVWKEMPEWRYKLFSLMLEGVKYTAHSKKSIMLLMKWLEMNKAVQKRCQPFVLMKGEFA